MLARAEAPQVVDGTPLVREDLLGGHRRRPASSTPAPTSTLRLHGLLEGTSRHEDGVDGSRCVERRFRGFHDVSTPHGRTGYVVRDASAGWARP